MTRQRSDVDVCNEIRRSLEVELRGIQELIPRLGESVERAVALLFQCAGKVVVTGIGKSGHIGRKIAATFSSTGTPAVFLHPVEAVHGDLGILSKNDVVLALSNSGGTEEIIRLLGPLRRLGVPIIAMTGNPNSELAKRAELNLDVSVTQEACPLNLAPTASTTAALAMGDALAVTLLSLRNFRPEDYAVLHPGGSLGKKLITTAGDLMETGGNIPLVDDAMPMSGVIDEMLAKRYGITSVVDSAGILVGAFSVGDLLRLHIKDRSLSFMNRPIRDYMVPNPKYVTADVLAARALYIMETNNIRALFVVDEVEKPIGIVGIYELLKAIDY